MNREAERHLDQAGKFLGKGEENYRKAAFHIQAAKDAGASTEVVAAALGRSTHWIQHVLKWAASPESKEHPSPFGGKTPEQKGRGAVEARRILREAPLEQVEQIIAELPFERQQAVAAAAGDRYAKVRQAADEKERGLTPAQRKEREAAVETVRQGSAEMMAGLDALAIVTDLEHATELLAAMVEKSVITPDGMRRIDTALAAFLDEYKVAQAMVGEEARA